MKLLLDVDGVLLNYVDSFEKYVKDIFGIKLVNRYAYHPAERYNISEEDGISYAKAFERSVDFQRLSPLPNAKFYLNKLYNAGARIRCVTAASDDSTVILNRLINLENVFGKIFYEISHAGLSKTKTPFFTDPDEIYIEDKLSYIIEAKKAGYNKTIFIKNDHTTEWNENKGFWNWAEVYEEIQKIR